MAMPNLLVPKIAFILGAQKGQAQTGSALLPTMVSARPSCMVRWPTGIIFVGNGLSPVYKWTGFTPLFVPVGLTAPSGSPALAGSGSGSITGTYRAYLRYLDADNAPSPLSPASADVAVTSILTVTFTDLSVPTDTRVIKRQILRNTAGQLTTFYVDIETTDLWSASLTSTKSDTTLATEDSVALFDDQGVDLTGAWDAPRTDKPILEAHRNRLWAAGEAVYRAGNAQVTFGSTTVTGIGTLWNSSFANRDFTVVGQPKRYSISSVNEANQTLTLALPYRGDTDLFALYAIRPALGQQAIVYYSEAGNPEGWPSLNNIAIAESGEFITALINGDSFLYVAFKEFIYRLTFDADPALDGSIYYHGNRGCINQRCWLKVGGTIVGLDQTGIWSMEGSNQSEIAGPVRDLFTRAAAGDYKIDWTMADYFHAVLDSENQVLRFFVSLSGPTLPRHALCYSIYNQQWWIEEYSFPITGSTLWRGIKDRLLLAGKSTTLYEHGSSGADGLNPSGQVIRSSVSSAGLFKVTAPDLVLPASGVAGSPVAVVKGIGKGQLRLIDSWTAATSTLTVTQPWAVLPDTSSVVVVGAVSWRWKSGWYGQIGIDSPVELAWTPAATAASLDLKTYLDRSTKSEAMNSDFLQDNEPLSWSSGAGEIMVDLTYPSGYAQVFVHQQIEMLGQEGALMAVEIAGWASPDVVRISGLKIGGSK